MIKINDKEKINKYIEKYEILEFLNKDLSDYMELFLFRRGEYICKKGENLKYLYFFVQGKSKVLASLSNGKLLLICFYNKFELIGDLEFVNCKNIDTSIKVIEDSYCIAIPVNEARQYLLANNKFLKYMCGSLGKKLENLSQNSSINLLYPLKNRLCSYIIATSIIKKTDQGNIQIFNENLTETSELLGASYRHLLRTLNNLVSDGAIAKEEKYYKIVNETLLTKLASDVYK
ncbi:MAG: cyclic nucleotide-binding domain-containing protein [Clostridiaceae bacterium]